MGGKSSDSGSREMINMQKQEAAAARAKELDRQGRITGGLAAIRNIFEGAPVMATRTGKRTLDGSGGLPPGYSYVDTPGGGGGGAADTLQRTFGPNPISAALSGNRNYQSGPGGRDMDQISYVSGGSRNSAPQAYQYGRPVTVTPSVTRSGSPTIRPGYNDGRPAPGGGGGGTTRRMVRGPDGRLYEVGSSVDYSEEYDTGAREGGIGDTHYNKYKQGLIDYYMPQVADKFKEAQKETTYRLARAGTLRSSAATDEQARLGKENILAEGKVRSDADQAAADMRARVASERAKAESQLYATENPEVAANQATSAIRNIVAEQPNVSPLGDIFTLAAIGGANYLGGRRSEQYGQKYVPGYRKSTSVVG